MPELQSPTRFGVLAVPQHRIDLNPTLQLERDLQLVQLADELGFNEFFVGEHHSVGHEIVGVPEIFIAAAAERTKHIKLGSGVVSVPYHNPFHIAEATVLLDHLTRGRYILGVGPGSLTSDAHMLGIDVADSRRKLQQGLDVIVRLLEGEVVTEKTDWFTLNEARLQLNSYTLPRPEMVAASIASPTGARLSGQYGMGMINLSALNPGAASALAGHWSVVEHEAAQAGRSCSRDGWRLAGIVHLADTEAQAREDLKYGFVQITNYLSKISILPALTGDTFDELVDDAIKQGLLLIGTPDSAIEMINNLTEQSGGFGSFLVSIGDFVPHAAVRRSLEIFAEFVIPHFRGQLARRQASEDWTINELGGGRKEWELAIAAATESYAAERDASARNEPPR
jgi:limonene 1,2-monooxygenase